MNELNGKYAHILLDSHESSDQQTESSFEESLKASEIKELSRNTERFENLKLNNSEPEKSEKSLNNNIEVTKNDKSKKVGTSKTIETAITDVDNKNVISVKAIQVKEEPSKTLKNSLSSTLRFTTIEIENAHEDLITCLDINTDATKLVTGR